MKIYTLLIIALLFVSCRDNSTAPDKIIYNAVIATMDEKNPDAEAIAIKDGKIQALGTSESILKLADEKTDLIDAEGRFVMPGIIEGHGHLMGMGQFLTELNLMNTRSWEEVLNLVEEELSRSEPGQWIVGRGWHQEKWDSIPEDNQSGYPTHLRLSEISPNNPVLLYHASYHALMANEAAMEIAGITPKTPNPEGGLIRRDDRKNAVGIFEENAMNLILAAYRKEIDKQSNEEKRQKWLEWVGGAEQEAFRFGVTGFHDAGVSLEELLFLKTLAESDAISIRLYVMLQENYNSLTESVAHLPVEGVGKSLFTARCIKAIADGALGSYGALLIEPYSDQPNTIGQRTIPMAELRQIAELAREHNLQLSIHAIGDLANKNILDLYESIFDYPEKLKKARWRIEHAQHLAPEDIPRFGKSGILASMQTVHCTSDAPFVPSRIGWKRAEEGAYVWRSLIDSGAFINNGTDVPVETINPFNGIYAAVTRKSPGGENAFFPDQTMTRKEALKSYTINNAYASFREGQTGNLEVGKMADLVVLNTNLLQCPEEDIYKTVVVMTVLGGEIVYHK